jgi:SHS2 domain-containing protein
VSNRIAPADGGTIRQMFARRQSAVWENRIAMYETFEHTADLGLRVRAPTLVSLFAEAAQSLYWLIIPDLAKVRMVTEHRIELAAESREMLLFDWLSELLFTFETRHLLLNSFDVRLDDVRLSALCRGEPFDPARHALDHEIKAITYHGLKLEQLPDATWLAEVIVDV